MAWTTFPSTATDVDSPLNVGLLSGIVDNFTALAQGLTGAPKIQEAAMGSATVNQGALKVANGDVTTTSIAGINTTLPGGAFGFWPRIRSSGANASVGYDYASTHPAAPTMSTTSATLVTRIYISNSSASTTTVNQTYVTASPPNWINKEDGEIPLFVYAQINKNTKDIISVYCADAAPWHYNGPTDIRPSKIVGGIKYRERKDMRDFPYTLEEAKQDTVKLKEYEAAFCEAPVLYEEITQDIKNADMSLISRPFEPDTDTEVILLNPVGDLIWQLCEMTKHENFDINELLHEGRFNIQNTAMNISTPPGVQAFDFNWK